METSFQYRINPYPGPPNAIYLLPSPYCRNDTIGKVKAYRFGIAWGTKSFEIRILRGPFTEMRESFNKLKSDIKNGDV